MQHILHKHPSHSHYFHLDDEFVRPFVEGKIKRVICTLDGEHSFHCALLPKKDVGIYIMVGNKLLKKFGLIEGDVIDVVIEEDTTPYQSPMPETLAEVMRTDPEGDKLFHELKPGTMRSWIYWVLSVKSIDLQIEKALNVMEFLKVGISHPRQIPK